MAGLSIDRKYDFNLIRWGILGLVTILVLAIGYYGYDWYVNGNKPPIIPLPASAYADSSVSESAVTQGDIDDYSVPASHPRYISIPALGITKARVEVIGLTKQNTLAMPVNINDAAWYSQSSTPGQGYGQVVIDAHNVGVSKNGVFHGLDGLANGDKITIERGDGKKFTYVVTDSVTIPLSQLNNGGTQKLMTPSDTSKEGLGLITDTGKWIPRDKVFNQRIIVRAVAS